MQGNSEGKAQDVFEARRTYLIGLHEEVWKAGRNFILPVVALSYFGNFAAKPSWQTATLAAAALLLIIGWATASAKVRHGDLDTGVWMLVSASMVMIYSVLLLREGGQHMGVVATCALLTYAALFSQRLVKWLAGAAVVLFIGTVVSDHYALVPKFAQSSRAQLLQGVAYIAVFYPIIAYFLRNGQRLTDLLFQEMQQANRKQGAVLETVNRIEPAIAGAVRGIQQVADGFAEKADRYASMSRNIVAETDRIAAMVAESASAAREARAIADVTREESKAGRGTLRQVEESFESAVRRIDSVRANIDALAGEIARTEAINLAMRDIAENLKVLAVNAALEAARSGEHGRGFAEVARELHRMIGQTSEDLKNSGKLLENIRSRATAISGDSETSTQQLRGSFEQLRAAGRTVDGLADSFLQASSRVDSIADAAERQRKRVDEIASAMRDFEAQAGELIGAKATLTEGAQRIGGAHAELRETLGA